tara:strand:- start:51 stop:407 length:357 start_codon:yes stop_codon:yes gene_type:complete
MPQITLKKADLIKFSTFLKKHDLDEWFLAKDQGAYIGAASGNDDRGTNLEHILFYFRGCDPNKNVDWFETQQDKFGGDDFGEVLESQIIHQIAGEAKTISMTVVVSAERIKILTTDKK